MFHAVAVLVFAFLAVSYVSFETNKKVSMKRGWQLLGCAVVFPLIASMISNAVGGTLGNLYLHGIGGGMSSALLFCYLYNLFDVRLSWRVQIIALFAFVSCLGVLNELLEYAIEVFTPLVMSLDSQDTWRDLVANTIGAFMAFGLVKIAAFASSKKQG